MRKDIDGEFRDFISRLKSIVGMPYSEDFDRGDRLRFYFAFLAGIEVEQRRERRNKSTVKRGRK